MIACSQCYILLMHGNALVTFLSMVEHDSKALAETVPAKDIRMSKLNRALEWRVVREVR